MGSNDGLPNERPEHTVTVKAFYIDQYEVTNAQYAVFVQATGLKPPDHWQGKEAPPPGKENHPVVNVSWEDAAAYSHWLAKTTGKAYRLTEAEWEKAARGPDGRIWPWGNKWETKRCNTSEGGLDQTTPVAAYPEGASPYRLLDMAGIVWEWCSTKWVEKAYPFQVQNEWTDD